MLQVARLSPRQLGESRDLVAGFLLSKLNPDGGFQDRTGASDLYYTVFGLEALVALSVDPPVDAAIGYLRSFRDGAHLDFVHLCCLARCWSTVSRDLSEAPVEALVRRFEAFRDEDGGYGSVYKSFLAVGAYQDLHAEMPQSSRVLESVKTFRAADGGFANHPAMPTGLTTVTAAAATLFRHFGEDPDPALGQWLLARACADGGFFAAPSAPIPDLLSTATALHALSGMHVSIEKIQEPCLDFVDSLWTSQGGFYGSWADDGLDCEYTYYGLLALGHLSL
jgi:prenyltransferase beta subunit